MKISPAMNVVVYAEPGPSDVLIETRSMELVTNKTVCGPGGGLGYLVLVQSDFDRLWGGVDRGDAHGTATAVLQLLGPNAEQFIGREDDFIFGWVGDENDEDGRVLLLQIIPREHTVAQKGSENN